MSGMDCKPLGLASGKQVRGAQMAIGLASTNTWYPPTSRHPNKAGGAQASDNSYTTTNAHTRPRRRQACTRSITKIKLCFNVKIHMGCRDEQLGRSFPFDLPIAPSPMATKKTATKAAAVPAPANDNITKLIGKVLPQYHDTDDFIDIVQWNLRWFNSKVPEQE